MVMRRAFATVTIFEAGLVLFKGHGAGAE